jgi:hypothetical protein
LTEKIDIGFHNRYMLALNHVFIKADIFVKVKLSFLPVGHTHDDVDQFFSQINRVLTREDVLTVPDLHRLVKKSFRPTPICHHLDDMAMLVPWWHQLIEKNFEGTSFPRVFLFKKGKADGKGESGTTGHYYRQQMQTSKKTTTDCWFPTNGEHGYTVFLDAEDANVLRKTEGVYCVPYKAIDTTDIRNTLKAYSTRMGNDQLEWWEETLKRFDEDAKGACKGCLKLRAELSKVTSNKKDSKEVANEKAKVTRKATKDLQEHMYSRDAEVSSLYYCVCKGGQSSRCCYCYMQGASRKHRLYADWLPPSRAVNARNHQGP